MVAAAVVGRDEDAGNSRSRAGARGGVAAALASAPAHAGGAIGWANAVTQFSTEGQAVGAAAVILGIIAIGAVLFFGLSGLVGTVIMACLGGALMANASRSRRSSAAAAAAGRSTTS